MTVDCSSLANVEAFQCRHLHLDWNVNFAERVLEGHVDLTLERVGGGSSVLALDASHLEVEKVFLLQDASSEGIATMSSSVYTNTYKYIHMYIYIYASLVNLLYGYSYFYDDIDCA
jgi:aminopeptidase N